MGAPCCQKRAGKFDTIGHQIACPAARLPYISLMGYLPRPIDLINKTVRLGGVKASRNVAYGEHPRQVLDIYTPQATNGPHPVIVFFYGGSWQRGVRGDYGFVAARLAACGYTVVVPDYRIYPETRYPGFLEDCTAAVDWVTRGIDAYGGDGGVVFLLGHSAGAYNAVMVALGAGAIDARAPVAGVIGLAGPYDFLPLKDPVIKAIFASPDLTETQPITHAHGDAPPMFLASGARDRVVLPRNTTALAARLRQTGGVVETRIYPKLGHIGILLTILPYFAWRAPVWRDVLGFIEDCRAGILVRPHSEIAASMVRRSL
jgi:acetyl esterase/lipase